MGGISGSIRYRLYNTLGVASGSASNTGIYEIGSNTGLYGVQLDLTTTFSGSILWSVNNNTTVYATEELRMDSRFNRHINGGRWKIDQTDKVMIFYQEDGTTELVRYALKDGSGALSISTVLERVKTSSA